MSYKVEMDEKTRAALRAKAGIDRQIAESRANVDRLKPLDDGTVGSSERDFEMKAH
jgi:hypothetical protein